MYDYPVSGAYSCNWVAIGEGEGAGGGLKGSAVFADGGPTATAFTGERAPGFEVGGSTIDGSADGAQADGGVAAVGEVLEAGGGVVRVVAGAATRTRCASTTRTIPRASVTASEPAAGTTPNVTSSPKVQESPAPPESSTAACDVPRPRTRSRWAA